MDWRAQEDCDVGQFSALYMACLGFHEMSHRPVTIWKWFVSFYGSIRRMWQRKGVKPLYHEFPLMSR
jgi:hypothetical protein